MKEEAIKEYSLELLEEYPFLERQESEEFIKELYEFLERYFFYI